MAQKGIINLIIPAIGILALTMTTVAEAQAINPVVRRQGVKLTPCHWGQVYCRRPDGNVGPRRTWVCPPHRDYENIGNCPRP